MPVSFDRSQDDEGRREEMTAAPEPLPPPLTAPDPLTEQAKFTHRYGVVSDHPIPALDLEQWCFLNRWPTEEGGLGRYRHFKNMTRMIWPEVSWNPWLSDQIRELCNDDTAVINGDVYVKTVTRSEERRVGKECRL